MAFIRCSAATVATPDRVRAALTDFSGRRPQLWPSLDEDFYEVHEVGQTWAEVTEGSRFAGGIWERCRYDWSDPDKVRITVLESNAFAAGGTWTYTIRPARTGAEVDLRVIRLGRTLRGRLLASVLRITGRLVFCGELGKTLDIIAASE